MDYKKTNAPLTTTVHDISMRPFASSASVPIRLLPR